ncbi:MAG: methionine--tRNA ligase [Saprospiraceae bacterium]|nr:methionine--tRNA ligase [Saprospiraceae bacterium]
MRQYDRYLITSALPYANGPLHIGHLAGAYLSADIYARFRRMMGEDVVFVCGSDEHGAAITLRAAKDGKTPKEIVDHYHGLFKETFDRIGVSFDIYHRTSADLHHKTSQEFFTNLYEKGEFEVIESEQYYDEEQKQFLADRYISGTCPKCGNEEAYGDQCENCGSTLSPTELINPKSKISGGTPVLKKTTHWYLPLNKYEAWLKKWIAEGNKDDQQLHDPAEWKNHVLGQCNSWLDNGLHPRSMTRDLPWGVDVPHHIEGHEGKKLYVWMDAPIGYISATKQWAEEKGKDWEPYWKDEDTALIHFIGKDNIVFHCLIFPSILNAHGDYILPVNVPANQFVNLEGDKLSTSKNWAVWVHEYLDDLPGKEDELRYCMIKNMPETKDSEFTWKSYQEANNSELVNNLANFVNRVIVLTNKYYEGAVPEFDEGQDLVGPDDPMDAAYHDSELLRLFDDLHQVGDYIRQYEFRNALQKLMEISSKGNQILQANEPWKKQKTNPEEVPVVMNLALQYVAALGTAIKPFLPFTSDKISALLNLPKVDDHSGFLSLMDALAEGEHPLKSGHIIGKPSHLFSRIDDSVIEAQVEKLKANAHKKEEATAAVSNPVKEEVTFDDFTKMDIRTATIIEASKVKKADKLLQIKLDLGFETRTVVSGIAQYYKPEDIIGQQVSLLANLAPRKIRGVESKGMILMAENSDGKLVFVAPSEASFENGSGIR